MPSCESVRGPHPSLNIQSIWERCLKQEEQNDYVVCLKFIVHISSLIKMLILIQALLLKSLSKGSPSHVYPPKIPIAKEGTVLPKLPLGSNTFTELPYKAEVRGSSQGIHPATRTGCVWKAFTWHKQKRPITAELSLPPSEAPSLHRHSSPSRHVQLRQSRLCMAGSDWIFRGGPCDPHPTPP